MYDKHIFLIGFMGTGKSSISSILAKRLSMPVIEMDYELASEEGMSIAEIFKSRGETYFRDKESELLCSIMKLQPSIVSCGGGTALRSENVNLMRKGGTVLLLTASPEQILERISSSEDRPVLSGNMNLEYIRSLMDKRMPCYEVAAELSVSTDNRSPEEICDEILLLLNNIRKV